MLLLTSSALLLSLSQTAWAGDPVTPNMATGHAILASAGGFISYLCIIPVLLLTLPWLAFCQWVDEDVQYLRTMKRELWNGIVLASGTVGLTLWLFMPWDTTGLFVAGGALYFVLTAGVCGLYVVIRNAQVDAAHRVFTSRHIKTALQNVGKKKVKKQPRMDAVERVRLNAHDGKRVPVPQERTQQDIYDATQTLLFDALWRRASDVELLVGATGYRLVYRIDGVATPRNELFDHAAAKSTLAFLKGIAGLDTEERRRPQAGSLSGVINGTEARMTEIEVNTSGTTQHEKLALRIIGDEHRLRIRDLGLLPQQLERLEELAAQRSGLILISGPRGSGITSTSYAALRNHDAFMQNLLTLEQKTLMDLENITQHVYDSGKHEASYARQLQTVLRREPDVVMVSDCLDRETAHLAVKAAAEEKKIYLCLQAKDSFEALKKLISLAGDTELVAKVLLAVTGQRLARKICIACRQAYKPDKALLKKANLPVDKIGFFYRPPRTDEWVDEKGNPKGACPNCQATGYFGRTGIFELLEINDSIRDLISKGQPVSAIRTQARRNGMLDLQDVGLRKVVEGITSMNEVIRVLRNEEGQPASKTRS